MGGLYEDDLVDVEAHELSHLRRAGDPGLALSPGRGGRVPVVLSIHGGPEAQERPLYQPLYQYLLSRGIAVLATNIRGSTGYGKSYQRLVQRDWVAATCRTGNTAVKWPARTGWGDERRKRFASTGGFLRRHARGLERLPLATTRRGTTIFAARTPARVVRSPRFVRRVPSPACRRHPVALTKPLVRLP